MNPEFFSLVNQFTQEHPCSWVSGDRTPQRNKQVGGSPNSWHTKGLALDVVFDSVAELWIASKKATLLFTGVEVDLTNLHLHIDLRDTPNWHVVCYMVGKKKVTTSLDLYLTNNQV